MPARPFQRKQHFHSWSSPFSKIDANFMFSLPSISRLPDAKLTFVSTVLPLFSSFNTFVWSNFQLVWSHSPGAWYDDGAPRWFREKRRLLRCLLLRIEPSRIKSDGSTTAFVVGGHLSILPCLWEAWALNFQKKSWGRCFCFFEVWELDVCLGIECMLLKKWF